MVRPGGETNGGPPLTIRRLRPDDDLVAAGAIVQASYFALPDYPHEDEYDALLADVAGRLHDTVVLGAFDDARPAGSDGGLVGCLTFVPDSTSAHYEFGDPEGCTFRYFGVAPGAQGRGVGEAMVRWCIAEAQRLGRTRILIHTLECMTAAQRMYTRMGFDLDPSIDADFDGIRGIGLRYEMARAR
jgi:GNAT superfamily N-acetyltransferase